MPAPERDPLDDYDYALPPGRIAQVPAPERDAARMLVLDRAAPGARRHASVADLPRVLRPGDLLVVNATKVLPARLRGRKDTGGAAEALVLGTASAGSAAGARRWRALVRCRGRLRVGQKLVFGDTSAPLHAEIVALAEDGEVALAIAGDLSPYAAGETPLPPYIRRPAPRAEDIARYQSVFARVPGSVAAPTASLHFTPALVAALAAAGVERTEVVLHVGPGTFRPIAAESLASGRLHAEAFSLPPAAAEAVARARARGGRVVAVGTTAARVLETCARADRCVDAREGETELFLRPGSRFQVVDALLTNFHLPRSSLLLLAAAFAGRELVLGAYADAIAAGYRFYSYGDCMLIQ
jgi:S-adenosylmethionine:tRNA ribosyltransferase-isomerase